MKHFIVHHKSSFQGLFKHHDFVGREKSFIIVALTFFQVVRGATSACSTLEATWLLSQWMLHWWRVNGSIAR